MVSELYTVLYTYLMVGPGFTVYSVNSAIVGGMSHRCLVLALY